MTSRGRTRHNLKIANDDPIKLEDSMLEQRQTYAAFDVPVRKRAWPWIVTVAVAISAAVAVTLIVVANMGPLL